MATQFDQFDRFEMAHALIAWTRKRFKELMELEYEDRVAMSVTCELRIVIKEMLDHLRSALEYCAQEVQNRYVRSGDAAFPIAIKAKGQDPGQDATYFDEKIIPRKLPRMRNVKPEAITLFRSFQWFEPGGEEWLSDLHLLWNENKHNQLSKQTSQGRVAGTFQRGGERHYVIVGPVGGRAIYVATGVGVREQLLQDLSAQEKATYKEFPLTRFDETGEIVEDLLDKSTKGVEKVVTKIESEVKAWDAPKA
jgi:hypothetical protein